MKYQKRHQQIVQSEQNKLWSLQMALEVKYFV